MIASMCTTSFNFVYYRVATSYYYVYYLHLISTIKFICNSGCNQSRN